jgi:transposase
MKKIKLNDQAAIELETVLKTTNDVRQLQRAQALLWLSEGDSAAEIAERLRVDRRTVNNWLTRFEQRHESPLVTRLADGLRSGRPITAKGVIDPWIDLVIDSDPRDFGYHSTIWTVPLLQTYLDEEHQMAVSQKSVMRALERLDIAWKRPRHQLALRARYWRQAKGGLNIAFGKTRAPSC